MDAAQGFHHAEASGPVDHEAQQRRESVTQDAGSDDDESDDEDEAFIESSDEDEEYVEVCIPPYSRRDA